MPALFFAGDLKVSSAAYRLLPTAYCSDPLRRRLNRRLRRLTGVGAAAAFQPADGPDGHVVVADDLTRQTDACQTALLHPGLFRFRHPRRLARDELDAACRATCISSTGVQDVDACILLDGKDESLAFLLSLIHI